MSQKQDFFKKIDDKIGEHPLKDRLQEELRDHADDAATYRDQSVDQSIDRLGAPRTIIKALRNADVSWKRFGIFALSCVIVMIATLGIQLFIIFLTSLTFSSLFWVVGYILIFCLPTIASIFLSGKRFHFSIAELFWYGFVFGIFSNIFWTAQKYFFNELNIIDFVNQGVVNWIEVIIFSFIEYIFFGLLAVLGALLRKGWGRNNNTGIRSYVLKIMKRILKIGGIVIGGFVAIMLLFVGVMYYINGGEVPEVGDSLDRVFEIADKRQNPSSKIRRIAVDTFEVGDDQRLKEFFQRAQIVLEGKGYNVGVADLKQENYGYILYKENEKLEKKLFPVIENKVFMFSFPSGVRHFYIIDKSNKVSEKFSAG